VRWSPGVTNSCRRRRKLLKSTVRTLELFSSPPSPVTAFRYKAHAKTRSKGAGKPKSAGKVVHAEPQTEPAPQKPNRKIGRLQKRLATGERKLEEAKAAGKPTRPLEDTIYEIEDSLRLAGQTS
jgi:hypothetical protein